MAEYFMIGHKQMHNGTDRVMHHSLSNLIIRDYLKDSTFIRPTERWTLMKIVDKVAYRSQVDWKLQMFVKVVRKKTPKYQTEMALNLSLS